MLGFRRAINTEGEDVLFDDVELSIQILFILRLLCDFENDLMCILFPDGLLDLIEHVKLGKFGRKQGKM